MKDKGIWTRMNNHPYCSHVDDEYSKRCKLFLYYFYNNLKRAVSMYFLVKFNY